MKAMKLILLLGAIVIIPFMMSGCYTQVAMRESYPEPGPEYPEYTETQSDSAGTVINNYYYDSPHHRYHFDYYYPFRWRTSLFWYDDPWLWDDFAWGYPYYSWYGGMYVGYPYWRPWYSYGPYHHFGHPRYPVYATGVYRTRTFSDSRSTVMRDSRTRGMLTDGRTSSFSSPSRTRIESVDRARSDNFRTDTRSRTLTPSENYGRSRTGEGRRGTGSGTTTPDYRDRSRRSSTPSYTPDRSSGGSGRSRSSGGGSSSGSGSYSPPRSSSPSSGGSSRGSSGSGSSGSSRSGGSSNSGSSRGSSRGR